MVSAIIPIYKNFEYTKSLVQYLYKRVDEIVVVNNNPIKEENAWLKKYEVVIVNNKTNVGVTKAWNQGIDKAKGDYYLILNNDLEFDGDIINNFLRGMEQGIGCVCPLFTCGTDRESVYKQKFTGFAFMVNKEVVKKIGKFDESMEIWYSDWDFFYKMKRAKIGVNIIPDVVVHHFESQTLSKISGKKLNKQLKIDKAKFLDKWGFLPDSDELLAICIPTATQDLPLEFVQSLLALKKPNKCVTLFISDCITDMARNLLVEKALKLKATEILFIDADMVFDPDLYYRLNAHNKDIVSGFAYNVKHESCVFKKVGDKNIALKPKQGLKKIDYTGLASTLIKTDVFKLLQKPYFYMTKGIYEDSNFYNDLKDKFEVYCDTDLVVGHLAERKIIK